MKDWLAETYRGLQKRAKLLQQTAYALGWTSLRPMAQTTMIQPDLRKQPPTAAPITSLTELLNWRADADPLQSLLKASVPLQQMDQSARPPDQPRLLVCHDLHGNYHQDALVQGSPDADYYKLTHWSCIDSFVYFSHALVTIPAAGWINAAHRNGVPVLGTFITEWEAGSLLCELMLWTEQSAEAAAMQLTNIAVYYGFEGWLLNIENPVLRRLIPNLIHFIRVLRKLMHEMIPGSQVIWYDAVTTAGVLEWQDTLSELNKPFFNAADAIFINYTWKEDTPAKAAAAAGDRRRDVYMGIDVFGRNTYGGGGMTCDIALKAAHSAGLSAALFAPAWVWEVGNRADWLQRQQLFWDKIQACCPPPRALLVQLPFSTCFDQGSVKPGSSASVQLFKADLLIPPPGLQVTFTYKPPSPPSPTSLQLWCWFEPSNAAQTTTDGANDAIPDVGASTAVKTAIDGIDDASADVGTSNAGKRATGGTGDASTDDGASKGAVAAGGVKVLAMLQPDGLALVSSGTSDGNEGYLELDGDMDTVEQHSNGWGSLQYSLPSCLPDFQHLTLRSIEVAAVTPARLEHSISAQDACLGYVGHIDVVSQGSTMQAPRVSDVDFQDAIWTAVPPQATLAPNSLPSDSNADSSAQGVVDRHTELKYTVSSTQNQQAPDTERSGQASLSQVLWLYVTLHFTLEQCSNVSRFEVFVRHGVPPAASEESAQQLATTAQHGSKTGWVWLGTAVTSQFRVTALECPSSDTAVQFAVRPADFSGRLVSWQHAAYAPVLIP